MCSSHESIVGVDMFKDRVTASASDTSMLLEEEGMRERPLPAKRARRSLYKNGTPTEEQSTPPNYVEYEGNTTTSQISCHFNKGKCITLYIENGKVDGRRKNGIL